MMQQLAPKGNASAIQRGETREAQKQVVAATMKDVALKANVSTATVSRALMNPDKVSQATRNRAEQAVLEVGYLPQSLGRNMKRGRIVTILASSRYLILL